jgi:cytochrome P450
MSNNCLFCVLFFIGQKYAIMEMKTALSSIIRNFKIKSIKKTKDLQPEFGPTVSVHGGVHVELTLRGKE